MTPNLTCKLNRKLTHRQYTIERALLEGNLRRLEQERDELLALWEAQQPVDGDELNMLHDQIADIEAELHNLHFRWETRNWTVQEWRQWELVTSNID